VTAADLPGPGEKVRHPKWGEGVVVAVGVRPDPADSEITVAFPDLGIKRLVAGYARLDRLGTKS
jgi:DNA helicase-2/ATP-dependent DNA helicase PcrA